MLENDQTSTGPGTVVRLAAPLYETEIMLKTWTHLKITNTLVVFFYCIPGQISPYNPRDT